MKPFAELRRLFSRYDFAVAQMLILYSMPALLMLLILARAGGAAFFIPFVFFILFGSLLAHLSRCPCCRRRPSSYYLVDSSTGEQIPTMVRSWPERQCSGCGTRLDGI